MKLLTRRGNALSQIGIRSINNGIIELYQSRYRLILTTTSVNFELLSEIEQDVLIDAFQAFLNTLNMTFQIIVRVRELNIEQYLTGLEATIGSTTELIYQQQLSTYSDYIRSLVTGNKILSRKFYVVISLDARTDIAKEIVAEELLLRNEIIRQGLEKLGMSSRPLATDEVLTYLSETYRPSKIKIQPLENSGWPIQ